MSRHPQKRRHTAEGGKASSTVCHGGFVSWLESDGGFLNHVPVSLWMEDFSQVKLHIDSLRQSGVVNVRRHLNRYPKVLLKLAEVVRILWANEETLNLYGVGSLSEFRSNLVRVCGKKSYDVFKGQVNAFAEGKTEFTGESDAVTPRGQTRHILLQARVDPSHREDLSMVFVSATDITGIRHGEDELRRSEQMYRQVFESAMVPMVMIDARTGIVVDSNASFHQFVGSSSPALTGRHISQLCVEGEGKRATGLLMRLCNGELSAVEQLRLCRGAGGEVGVVVNASVVNTEEGMYVLLVFSSMPSASPLPNRRTTIDRRRLSAVREKLTERERMVLTLISTGHSNKLIGEQLAISRKTVESHRLKIMQKLDVHKATELVRYALTSGILLSD